jgi:hypothetical protein
MTSLEFSITHATKGAWFTKHHAYERVELVAVGAWRFSY